MATSTLNPQTTALLLLDMQQFNLNRIANKDEIISNATNVLSTCRQHHFTIVHVRVAFEEEDYQNISPNNKGLSPYKTAATAMEQGIHNSLPHTQFHPNLTPQEGEISLRKTRMGAFSTTDLQSRLQARNITTLILLGISTSGAILSTVRDACDKDYAMTVVSDACADMNEQTHNLLIEHILPRNCDILTSKEIIAEIDKGRST